MYALQEKKPNKAKWITLFYFTILIFHEISLHDQFSDAHFTGTVISLNVIKDSEDAMPTFQAEVDFHENDVHTLKIFPHTYSSIEIGQDYTVSIPYKPLFTGSQVEFYPSLSELPSKAELVFMGMLKLLSIIILVFYLCYSRVA